MTATTPDEPLRERIAHALDRKGAQLGDCGHEPGDAKHCGNGCWRLLLGYADAVLAVLAEPDSDEREALVREVSLAHAAAWSDEMEHAEAPDRIADAVLAAGFRRAPAVEWEYGWERDGWYVPFDWHVHDGEAEGWTLVRRRKAGPWKPCPEQGDDREGGSR